MVKLAGEVACACNPSYSGGSGRRILPGPGRWRLQGAEIVPLHSSLVKEGDSVSKKQKNKKLKIKLIN